MLGRLLSRPRDAAKLRAEADIVSLAHAFASALSKRDGVSPKISNSGGSPPLPVPPAPSTPAQRAEKTLHEEAAPQAGAYREQPKTSAGVSRQRVVQGATPLARRTSGRLLSTALIALALFSGGALLMANGVSFEIVQETDRKATDKQALDKAFERHAIEAKPTGQPATRVDEVASPKPMPEAIRPSAEEEAQAAKPENTQRQAAADSRGSTAQKPTASRVEDAKEAEAGLNLSEQDRKKVQMALDSLGHSIPTATGVFGPRSRLMIAAWQKKQGLPETGFLDNTQLLALHEQAGSARRVIQAKPAAAPEQVEAALKLSEQDREKVQMALNSIGHPMPVDGLFGPRTRAMIKAWQKAQGLPDTGYLTEPQLATLFQQAANALPKQDKGRRDPKQD
jgi:peptidoglycan hydrolase-like protein with peptidoglycan-binding domain